MSKVAKFYPSNAADSADNVLEQALGVYDQVALIGLDHDGELEVRSTNGMNDAEVLFLFERFKQLLISQYNEETE